MTLRPGSTARDRIEKAADEAVMRGLGALERAAREDGLDEAARGAARATWEGALKQLVRAWMDHHLGDAHATLARATALAERTPTLLGVVLARLAELTHVEAAAWHRMEDAPAWLRALWVMHLARTGNQSGWEAMTRRVMEIVASRTGVGTRVTTGQTRHVLERWRWPDATPPLVVLAFAAGERPESDVEWAALVRAEHAAGGIAGVYAREGPQGVARTLERARAREAGLLEREIEERAFNWVRLMLGAPAPGVVLEAMRRRWVRERALATDEPAVLRATARGQMTWERTFAGPADVIAAASAGQGAQCAEEVLKEASWGGARYWIGPGEGLAVAERVPHEANDNRIEAMKRVMRGDAVGWRWWRRESAKDDREAEGEP